MNEFLFVVVPYLCLATFVVGHWWRYRYDKFGWTTRSSQLYENRLLRIGSPLFHFGMLGVIGGHLIGLLVPQPWTDAIGISNHTYHVVAVAEPVLGLPFPPGQHRLALVESGLEVRRRLVRGRVEPHRLPVVVEDQRAALAGARRRRDEDAAGGSARRRVEDGHLRRLQVRPRHEVMRVACASSALRGALERPGRALATTREDEPYSRRQRPGEQPAPADRAVFVFLVQPGHGTFSPWRSGH